MWNNIYIALKYLYFALFTSFYIKRKAKKKYRVVQCDTNDFKLEEYQLQQCSSKSGNTGYPYYGWVCIYWCKFSEVSSVNKNEYIKRCNRLREEEYDKLRSKCIVEIEKHRIPKYPKIIF